MFPASAGMIPLVDSTRLLEIHVPRKRGDDPIVFTDEAMESECSPQARG